MRLVTAAAAAEDDVKIEFRFWYNFERCGSETLSFCAARFRAVRNHLLDD
jgi:hypothetical protein